MVEVTDAALQQAAGEGMDAFIQVFTDAYKRVIGGELTADTMPLLTGEQHSLLAYQIFRDELMEVSPASLVQNGYGGYIFANPFAKVMRLWGVGDLRQIRVCRQKDIDVHREDLERVRLMTNLWQCTSSMRLLMSWKMSFWRKKRSIRLWLQAM